MERESRTFPIAGKTYSYWPGRITRLNPVHDEVAELLISGYTLTIKDIEPICKKQEMSSSQARKLAQTSPAYFFAETGVKIARTLQSGRIIFYCPDLLEEETDMAQTRERIKLSLKRQ